MPPLRNGRASKACDCCRKNKTRCYTSESENGKCLRCKTLSQPCSLESPGVPDIASAGERSTIKSNGNEPAFISGTEESTNSRLQRLEVVVEALVYRIDNSFGKVSDSSQNVGPPLFNQDRISTARSLAPVLVIRDAAIDAGIQSQEQPHTTFQSDVISSGLISQSTAYSLLRLFHIHYGRWVRLPEEMSMEYLIKHVEGSPLLLSSILLISVRQTTQALADAVAPRLFEEVKRLLASSLLVTPQSVQFFQAVIILSLWSTTIGQEPMSVDSWLLTGYALQQALATPDFAEILQSGRNLSVAGPDLDQWCIWSHLCLAHLQYCVGTQRQAQVNSTQIERCLRSMNLDAITNYEARMVAEVELYWIIYNKCCGSESDLGTVTLHLQSWKRKWRHLFDQPRAQFLRIGFHFAHLLAHYHLLKALRTELGNSGLSEMIKLSQLIINLAIDTTDDRTKHLTDHIYHTVTFSALTLCRISHNYESRLRNEGYDVDTLDKLVHSTISWLNSIGLPCHAATVLGRILQAQFKKLRPSSQINAGRCLMTAAHDDEPFDEQSMEESGISQSFSFWYPHFIGSELSDIEAQGATWPEWG